MRVIGFSILSTLSFLLVFLVLGIGANAFTYMLESVPGIILCVLPAPLAVFAALRIVRAVAAKLSGTHVIPLAAIVPAAVLAFFGGMLPQLANASLADKTSGFSMLASPLVFVLICISWALCVLVMVRFRRA